MGNKQHSGYSRLPHHSDSPSRPLLGYRCHDHEQQQENVALETAIQDIKSHISKVESTLLSTICNPNPSSKTLTPKSINGQKAYPKPVEDVDGLKHRIAKLESVTKKQEEAIAMLEEQNARMEKQILKFSVTTLDHETKRPLLDVPAPVDPLPPASPISTSNDDLNACLMILIFLLALLVGVLI